MVKKKINTNPNKVNQYTAPDPRQALFLKNYLDPKSDTFANAYQSAMKAKYSKEYAENITNVMPDWLSENIGGEKLLNKAIKNLEEFLDMPITIIKEKDGKSIVLTDAQLLKIKQDTSKFVVSRQGKNKGWSERTELSNPDGTNLIPTPIYGGKSIPIQRHSSNTEDIPNEQKD